MRIVFMFILFTLFQLINNCFAQHDTILLDPAVRYGKLPNGLTYYIKNSKGQDKVQMNLIVKTGYLNEEPDQLHLTHVLEHIVIQLTVDSLKRHNLTIGRDFNASTGFRTTEYYLTVPLSDDKKISLGLRVLRKWSGGQNLDSAIIESGRGSTLNEIMGGIGNKKNDNSVNKILSDVDPRFLTSSTNGIKNVQHFKHASLHRYYEEWYRPDNQAVVIVGDINVDEIEKSVKEIFADFAWTKQTKSIVIPYYEPSHENRDFITLSEKNGVISVNKYIKFKAVNLINKSDYRRSLIIDLFNNMAISRWEDLKYSYKLDDEQAFFFDYKRRIAFGVPEAGIDALTTWISFESKSTPEQIKKGFNLLLLEEERVFIYGFLQDEIEKAKKIVKENIKQGDNDLAYLAERYVRHFMGTYAAPDEIKERDLKNNLLSDITSEEINKEIKSWKSDRQPEIIITPDVKAAVKNLPSLIAKSILHRDRLQIAAYDPAEHALQPVMSKEEIKAIEKDKIYYTRTKLEEFGVIQYRLQNGIEIILRPSKEVSSSTDKIILNAFRAGKDGAIASEDCFSLRLAVVLAADSINKLSNTDVKRFLAKKNGECYRVIDYTSAGMRPSIKGEILASELESLLQVVYQFITNPAIQENKINDATEILRKDKIESTFFHLLSQKYAGVSKFSFAGTLYEPVPYKDIRSSYEIYFQDISNYRFVFTGNFNEDSVQRLIVKYLDALPIKHKLHPTSFNTVVLEEKTHAYLFQIDKPDGGSTYRSFIYTMFDSLNLSNRAQLQILTVILRDLLFRKLRDEMGGIYSPPGVNVEQVGYNIIRLKLEFVTNYGDRDKLMQAAWDEIDKIMENGPSAETLLTAVNNISESNSIHNLTPQFWQTYFQTQCLFDYPIDEIKHWKSEFQKVTSRDIQQCAQKYLRHDNLQFYQLKGE